MSRSIIRSKSEDVWRDRVGRASRRSGSIAAFCKAEGISSQALSYWQQKLRHVARRRAVVPTPRATARTASPFVGVEIMESEGSKVPSGSRLPEAKWIAELILHLTRGGLT